MAFGTLRSFVHFQKLVSLLNDLHERLRRAMGLSTFVRPRIFEISQDDIPSF
jgi:hypothetical protein